MYVYAWYSGEVFISWTSLSNAYATMERHILYASDIWYIEDIHVV